MLSRSLHGSVHYANSAGNCHAIQARPNCSRLAGISLKTQELYALVFVMRYLDVFTTWISLCAPIACSCVA